MRLLATIGVLAIAVVVIAAAYFFGGYYSVAATAPEPAQLAWALSKVRSASIERHATDTPPFALDEDNAVQRGAKLYAESGCAQCHGAPGTNWGKFAEGLNPGPPDLKEVAESDEAAEIFWAVKNGIRMTGMPSFEKAGLDDAQVWQIAAFVKRLPQVSEEQFKAWTATPAQ